MEQDRGHRNEGDDRAHEAGQHVEGAADLLDVAARHGHDLAGGDGATEFVPEVRRVAGDELLGAARRCDPVGDGHPVPQNPGRSLDGAEQRDDPDGPKNSGLITLGRGLYAGADACGHGRHGNHPENTPGDTAGQEAPLHPRHPPEIRGS